MRFEKKTKGTIDRTQNR